MTRQAYFVFPICLIAILLVGIWWQKIFLHKLKSLKRREIKTLIQKAMSKYDFIKQGNLLYWHDPDN